jgi:hypothetical protein
MKKRALFGRKVSNLKELKKLTQGAVARGQIGEAYTVIREVKLSGQEFRNFASDFFEDQSWISPEDGGVNKSREIRCVKVICQETGEKVLVNSEGYTYSRYTALEQV